MMQGSLDRIIFYDRGEHSDLKLFYHVNLLYTKASVFDKISETEVFFVLGDFLMLQKTAPAFKKYKNI